jgi:hypothetical protein
LQLFGPDEFIPHETPEARAVKLSAGDGIETEVSLQLYNILHCFFLN